MTKRIAALVALSLALAGMTTAGRTAATGCTPDPDNKQANDHLLPSTETLPGGYKGVYAVPADPKALVVMMHGYSNDASAWVCHVMEAAEHGAAAFALDYPGQAEERGWRVQEGATASIDLAKHFLRTYHTIATVVVFGVSMGGNASGLYVADAKDHDVAGRSVVDYWFDVEGVANLRQEYLLAKAVGQGNEFAANAAADIEEEAGGTLWEVPEAYSRLTIVDRIPDVIASGVKGIVVVHGVDDGLVPYNQSRELQVALRQHDPESTIGLDVYTIARRGSGEPGTTATGNVLGPLGQTPETGGHAWEGSDTHVVMRTALQRLWALLDAGEAVGPDREFLVDGDDAPRPLP